ncbi:MAG: GNAT family N-acetyltransferase [Actinomycetota bacterium]
MVEIRAIRDDEWQQYHDAIGFGFGGDPQDSDEAVGQFRATNRIETTIVAVDRGRMVATFGSYDLEITMPGGGRLPMAGTTHVTVHPTHRRKGILTEMMRMHLDQAVERGQPMAGLWASEERIYGRFGYGPAVYSHELQIPVDVAALPPGDPDITLHPIDVDQAKEALPPIYEQQLTTAPPGRLVRSDEWWRGRRFFEQTPQEQGPRRRYVVAERDGEPVGYLIFRQMSSGDWSEGTTEIKELVAADDDVRRSLWNFATNVDLFRNVKWWNAPLDDPLVIEAHRFRRVTRSVMDTVWLRPLDVPAVLTGRRYERDGGVTIAVTDRFGPAAGTYRLDVTDGAAVCEATTATPDVTLAVEELGRMLLGGGAAALLARAGLIVGDTAAIGTLHDLFVARVPPHSPEVF